MGSTDLSHIRLYMAAAIHSLGRGTDGVIDDGVSQRREASHAGTDQEIRDH